MMLQKGLTDPSLQRELGAVRKNPTFAAFNEKIEGFEQARRTTASSAFGIAVGERGTGALLCAENVSDVQKAIISFPSVLTRKESSGLNPSKISCSSVFLLAQIRISCYTSGAMSLVPMVTAQLSLCLAVTNALVCLPCLPKSPHLTFTRPPLQRIRLIPAQNWIMINQSFPFLSPGQPVFLQDSKSSAWDKQGVVVSMPLNRLSYVINVNVPCS